MIQHDIILSMNYYYSTVVQLWESWVKYSNKKVTDKVADKAAEKAADKAAEKAADKAAEKATDKAAEKAADKAAEKAAEKVAEIEQNTCYNLKASPGKFLAARGYKILRNKKLQEK